MFDISDAAIEELATNSRVFVKGLIYYNENRVVELEVDKDNICVSAVVRGSARYKVEACFSPAGRLIHMFCDCPAFHQYEGACKHIVAVLKACQRRFGGSVGKGKTKTKKTAKMTLWRKVF